MSSLTLDLTGVRVDLLRHSDSPVLVEAIQEATDPAPSAGDGAGFDNRM